MRKSKGGAAEDSTSYFTYRPLSNLPTPPPTARQPRNTGASFYRDDGEILPAVYRGMPIDCTSLPRDFCSLLGVRGRHCTRLRGVLLTSFTIGPAIHLVNLIPSTASLVPASAQSVQSMLTRTGLPLETIALAVCILDSLDAKFGRKWRLTCPLRPASESTTPELPKEVSSYSKRHSLPLTRQPSRYRAPQLHIDSVRPEIIVLAALVIADKFTEDSEQSTQAYCSAWGRGVWSSEQLNATERSIMEGLNYRIMPLCDEDCLADAMVDMQIAGQEYCAWDVAEPSPPHSDDGATVLASEETDDDYDDDDDDDDDREDDAPGRFVPGHSRSKTMVPSTSMRSASVGLGLSWATAI